MKLSAFKITYPKPHAHAIFTDDILQERF